jgi:hypothetical protein
MDYGVRVTAVSEEDMISNKVPLSAKSFLFIDPQQLNRYGEFTFTLDSPLCGVKLLKGKSSSDE